MRIRIHKKKDPYDITDDAYIEYSDNLCRGCIFEDGSGAIEIFNKSRECIYSSEDCKFENKFSILRKEMNKCLREAAIYKSVLDKLESLKDYKKRLR